MEIKEHLQFGCYYHIYNRGNNFEKLFYEKADYLHFMKLYDIFITPVAESYSWCLMGNHFHFLVRIMDQAQIGFLIPDNAKSRKLEDKWRTIPTEKVPLDKTFTLKPDPENMFQHLFSTYAKWINNKYKRCGALFIHTFKRKHIDCEIYLQNMVRYIHNNPVKHGFSENIIEYPWTSFLTIISSKQTKLKRETVLGWFDDINNFKSVHQKEINYTDIKDYIIEDEE